MKNISRKLKLTAIDKAFRKKQYFYIVTINEKSPEIVCAENIAIDPTMVTIDWVASPNCDTYKLEKEGWL